MNPDEKIFEEFEISELEERVEFSVCGGECNDDGTSPGECKVF